MAYLFTADAAAHATDRSLHYHGGYGYSREFPVERMMRDNKLNEIGAGTNEVMIMIIAKNLLRDALRE